MVEGAAKNLIGKRLKLSGAQWSVENAMGMGYICCPSTVAAGRPEGIRQLDCKNRSARPRIPC
jgi:hypothetical protein